MNERRKVKIVEGSLFFSRILSMKDYGALSLQVRKETGGQIFTGLRKSLETKEDLSVFYTPGIAEPCREIAKDKSLAKQLTVKKNMVAVISDGSAVLGLGNIGPEAGLPVMEGKSMLFKQFGDVDAIPIVLDTQDTEEIIDTVKRIAPTFGGINLEDISAPRCFEIEERLINELDIPVFHDDQHGTAMVVLAGLMNALKIIQKEKSALKVVIAGAGAAGIAIAKLLKFWGVYNIEMVDSKGIVACERSDINEHKKEFCARRDGSLSDALREADVFIGVSKPGTVTQEMVRSMNEDALIFAMSNPTPEIFPDEALAAGAKIVATGRSDLPNQINNVLIFPGLFRGLLDVGATKITTGMKIAASEGLARLVEEPTPEKIIPDPLDTRVGPAVAEAVKRYLSRELENND